MATSIKPSLGQNATTTITASIGVSPSTPSEPFVIQRIQDCLDFSGPPVDSFFVQWDAGTQKFVMAEVEIPDVPDLLPIDLTAEVTGILPVVNGGTGVANLTANRILFGNGTTALSTNANITFNPSTNNFVLNGYQVVTSASASTIPLSVKHASTPSVDFFNVLDSANAKVFAVSSDKTLLIPPAASVGQTQSLTWKTDGTQWGVTELQIQRNSSTNSGIGTQLKLTDNGVSAYIKFFSRSFIQAVNDLEFHSQGGLNISMPYTGGTYIYNPVTNSNAPSLLTAPTQTLYAGGGTPSPLGLFVFEQCTYAATSGTTITDTAALLIKSAPLQGVNMTNTNRYGALIITGQAAAKGLSVRGVASQTGNLTQWEDSSSTVVAAIKSNGAFTPASLADSDASNGTLYYSTTASKLVFKDSGGVVNNLY